MQQMEKAYEYVWKHNGPLSTTDTSVRFTKPLKKGAMFTDLRNGHTYNVLAISEVKAEELGSFPNLVPKEAIHTSDAKPISDEQLATLQDKHKYKQDPEWPYLILSLAE